MSEHEEAVIVKRMGGHAVAAVAGIHPHLKPIEVYAQMVEDIERADPTPAMVWGTMIEPMLLEWAARELQRELSPGDVFMSTEHEWLRSHPDARIGDRELVSAKQVGRHRARFWGPHDSDHIPDYANGQEQLYMGIEHREVSHVVASIGGDPPKLWAVPFAPRVFELFVSIAYGFIRNHVIPRLPPPPDGSEKYNNWIKSAFAKVKPELVKVGSEDDIVRIAREYQEQRTALKKLELEAEKNAQALKLVIGDKSGLELPGTGEVISYAATKRIGKDGKPVRMFTVPAAWRTVEES